MIVPAPRALKIVEATVPAAILEDVKDRLTLVGVRGMTVAPVQVVGAGRRAPSGAGGGGAWPRVSLQVVVTADMVETAVNAILTVARRGTGHDGEIVVVPADDAIRIRTGERGEDAL
jgi:nitrogen regulatory protein PII